MTDVERLLQRQAAWQKSRTQLTWPEKIRLAEQMRDGLRHWRIRSKSPAVPQCGHRLSHLLRQGPK